MWVCIKLKAVSIKEVRMKSDEATFCYSAKRFEGWASEKIALRKFSGKE